MATGQTRTSTTSYDDANNRTVATYANGLVTTSLFDHTGAVTSIVNTNTASAALGTTSYSYDKDGRLRLTTDPTGIHNYVMYDDAGRKVGDVAADGALTQYVYNGAGQVVKTVRYADRLTAATVASLVDAQGNPSTVAMSALVSSLASVVGRNQGADQIARSIYDAAGRLVYRVDEAGDVTQLVYDGASRVTDEVHYATPVVIARTVAN